ncbi:hypothetical protein GCM10010441_39890 [Kitasatospora paracochleata]|uniref:Uncharacterized protein n=1 Tax=Kitasatospora paracochleata TaxID=58354 RepID=A0ABT1IVX4_9ACTN|nr:hypothetical protein [Kitasatospora paracochleata]MCP2309291.1 hypothetical protein [Kitasatospora paracochleata]
MTPAADVSGDCPATATVQLDGVPCTAVCNLPADRPGTGHEDLILGAWTEPPGEHRPREHG